ncbi:DNA cross-link repair protein PSO2 SCDLUD_002639 [Saccharomycodes ludwigii]|uniref:DNA cross-link repair protein PSO2 n=1 Tax=Saccharomycodes ludwigii TaxID=36035 RepID=UPI001E8571F3|nr:hypothetical protein SCDLUD_002639 [Saccharomycodes ludwigii]KAH3901156.1 hypothetical protein SCDLUD_002639 [Saccharomycodes ludwigii]
MGRQSSLLEFFSAKNLNSSNNIKKETIIILDDDDDDDNDNEKQNECHYVHEEKKVEKVDKEISTKTLLKNKNAEANITLNNNNINVSNEDLLIIRQNIKSRKKQPNITRSTKFKSTKEILSLKKTDFMLSEKKPIKKILSNNIKQQKRKRKNLVPPHYKILTFDSTHKIVVDGFNYTYNDGEIKHFFLSHFHSDHYIGLSIKWFTDYEPNAIVYCSKITASLLISKFNIPSEISLSRIKPLEFNTYYDNIFPKDKSLKVLLIDANHCPGAALFHFEFTNNSTSTIKYLHTGDFRYHHEKMFPFLSLHHYNKVYLDTTYLNIAYQFPSQENVINVTLNFLVKYCLGQGHNTIFNANSNSKNNIQLIFKLLNYNNNNNNNNKNGSIKKKYIIFFGGYTLGKEPLSISIASELNCNVLIDRDTLRAKIPDLHRNLKYENISIVNNSEGGSKSTGAYIQDIFENSNGNSLTNNDVVCCIVPMHHISKGSKYLLDHHNLRNYVVDKFDTYIIGVQPTGWNFYNRYDTRSNDISNNEINHEQIIRRLLCSKNNSAENNELVFNEEKLLQQCKIQLSSNNSSNTLRKKKIKDINDRYVSIKIPYSDHSSFTDLVEFGVFNSWDQIIPTVYDGGKNGETGNKEKFRWFKYWKIYKNCKNARETRCS